MECGIANVTVENRNCIEGENDTEGARKKRGMHGCDGGQGETRDKRSAEGEG